MVLPSDISASSNDIGNINNIIDEYTDIYYVNSNNNKIRCPEGYVFEHSNLLFGGGDRSVIEYTTDNWININGEAVDWNPVSNTIRCRKAFCDPLSPVNSEQEYNVIVDNINNNSNEVTCNGGYVYDTTDTRMGKVKCGIIPIMNNVDFKNKVNKVNWIVDNTHNELFCEDLNETDCDIARIPVSISNDTSKIYDNNGKSSRCTWIPPIDDTGDSGFIRTQGQCKFLHRADLNNTNPICRSMYCNSREIPNSNRNSNGTGPLPGPENGSIHGDCINFDGQLIDNITNSSDCTCFQHKSCDMCTTNENCQWCGSDGQDGGFCYSTKTHLSICDSGIRHDRGGTCIHPKTKRSKLDNLKPEGGWTKDTCENSVCVNQEHWYNLDEHNYMSDKNDTDLYKNNMTGPDDCRYDNNFWDDSAIVHRSDTCIVKNTRLDIDEYRNTLIDYYPINEPGVGIKFNISDKICVPNNNITYNNINICNGYSKDICDSSPDCQYINNPLKDSIFNWSNLKHIEFNESGTNCPIQKIAGTDGLPNKFSIQTNVGSQNGYIILENTEVPNSELTADYFNTCAVINPTQGKNLLNDTFCGYIGGPSNNQIHDCESPNIKYCDSNTTINGAQACPPGNFIDLNGNLVSGCQYYPEYIDTLEDNYLCYGDMVQYKCSNPDTEYYNCEKYLLGNTNTQGQCTNTDYNVIGTDMNLISPLDSIENVQIIEQITNNIKPYILCDTSKNTNDNSAENRCNLLGDEYAHWGKLCKDNLDNKYPIKHICNLHPNATWGKFINGDSFEWGCYNDDDGTKYSNEGVCGLISKDNDNILELNDISLTPGSVILQIGDFTITPSTSISNILLLDTIIEQNNATGTATGTIISTDDTIPINTNIISLNILTTSGQFIDNSDGAFQQYTIINNGITIAAITSRPGLFKTFNVLTVDLQNNSCIIDSSPDGNSFDDYKYICENSNNHTIGFKFFENNSSTDERGICKNRRTREQVLKNDNTVGQDLCTSDNMIYTNEYNYNNNNSCPRNSITKPDIPSEWTGGEISSEDGIHVSECSPSIMSNCNVSCNPGYGGGGDYVCLYNKDGGDICDKINNKPDDVLSYKQELCESYPSCMYDENGCHLKPGAKTDGHLEWVGSDCYKLDNEAFSHGIAKLPGLDKFIPPFIRVIIYLTLYTLFASLFIFISIKFGVNITGKIIDSIFNKSFESINKLISILTGSDKILFDFVLSSDIDLNVKIGTTILTIGLFIGSYFFFRYIRTNIKRFTNNLDTYFNRIFRIIDEIKPQVDFPLPDATLPDATLPGVTLPGVTLPDATLPDFPDTDEDELNPEDQKTLQIVIQAVISMVVLMVIILVVYNSLK